MKKYTLAFLLVMGSLFFIACSDESTSAIDGDSDLDRTEEEMDADSDGDLDSDTQENERETDAIADGDIDLEPEAPGPLALPRTHPPTAPVGEPYSYRFEATGGKPPYSNWRLALGDEAHGDKAGLPLGDLPPGLSLNAETGDLSGTPNVEGFYYFTLAVDDSAGESVSRTFGMRVGDPGQAGALLQKAHEYQAVYEARHVHNGFSYDVLYPDDPDGNLGLTTLGDAAFVSGQCTMAMAFRHAVEQSEPSAAMLAELVNGWRSFQRMTGVPGLIGRSFFHKDDPVEETAIQEYENDPPETKRWLQGAGEEFKDYIWRADTSRDQVTGAMLGMAMAYELADDPDTKETAATFLTEFADHIWDHDLKIVDPDGEMTTYGDMSGERLEGFPVGNGQAAACVLAWFKMAAVASGEERFEQYFNELMYERDYLNILKDYEWTYSGYGTKWYNTYMSWENWFHLMRLVDDPILHDKLKAIMRDTLWLNTNDITPNRRGILEHNAVKAQWYVFGTGEQDPEALWRVLWQLDRFQNAPLRDRAVHNSDDPSIVINPERTDEALYALPVDKRREDMVMWHRGPYLLDGGSDAGRERTGCDYMLPYWMGRYYGLVSSEW